MLLSARILQDVQSVNSYRVTPSATLTAGDVQSIYVQLVDASLDKASEGFNPPYRRYCPPTGALLSVILLSINGAKQVTRSAVQPFSDPSIWMFNVLSSDKITGTVNLQLQLVENGKTTRGLVSAGLLIYPQDGNPQIGF